MESGLQVECQGRNAVCLSFGPSRGMYVEQGAGKEAQSANGSCLPTAGISGKNPLLLNQMVWSGHAWCMQLYPVTVLDSVMSTGPGLQLRKPHCWIYEHLSDKGVTVLSTLLCLPHMSS